MLARDPRPPEAPVRTPDSIEAPADGAGGVRIRCPVCGWRHDFRPHWMCERCLTSFDTFRTRAHCPSCSNRWVHTWCPSCSTPSPHEEWYAPDDPSPA
jgi:hypothetical protein